LHINGGIKVLTVVDRKLHTTSLAQVEESPSSAAAAAADTNQAAEAPAHRKDGEQTLLPDKNAKMSQHEDAEAAEKQKQLRTAAESNASHAELFKHG
jgi:hypothetical protein